MIGMNNDLPNEMWDEFVDSSDESLYTQSSLWAQVRKIQGWKTYQIYILKDGMITAGAQILIRPLKYIGWGGYIPAGLLNPGRDVNLEEELVLAIQKFCRANQVRYLSIPYWNAKDNTTLDLEKFGFKPSLLGDIDAPGTNLVDLTMDEEKIIGGMDKSKRREVRAAQKRGLTFQQGTRPDIEEFYRLHLVDSHRLGYLPFAIDTYYKTWDIYAKKGRIKLFLNELSGKIINASLYLIHRDRIIAYKTGWSGEERERFPNVGIHWNTMLWAKENGFRIYDFGGLDTWALNIIQKGKPFPEKFVHSISNFKYEMGKNLEIYPPLYEYIPNPLLRWGFRNFISRILDKGIIRKTLRIYKQLTTPPATERSLNK